MTNGNTMTFQILRGFNEIGGSCVEIKTETTRIVIDMGMPLLLNDGSVFDSSSIANTSREELLKSGVLPNIPNLYESGTETSLIISHAHIDHYGLLNYVDENCKVYLGKATHNLLNISGIFNQRYAVNIKNYSYFKPSETFTIGDIEVTPFLIDHSAFDAYAFLFKSAGKSLFYSGDFRNHGRKGYTIDNIAKNIKNEVDCLIMEGTTIGGLNHVNKTEFEIENELFNVFKEQSGIKLVYLSSQNIDRIVSVYKACLRSSKTMVVDLYVANILKSLINSNIPQPSDNFPIIKILFGSGASYNFSAEQVQSYVFGLKKYKISKEEIFDNADNIVMLVRTGLNIDREPFNLLTGGDIIFSMWAGYLKNDNIAKFIEKLEQRKFRKSVIHTGGHADKAAMDSLIDAVKPRFIVPIHTLHPNEYEKLFPEHNIIFAETGKVISI